jgi:hypothetical protein
METIRSSMERALALQLRLSDCQRIICHATDFANVRWVPGQNCFMDVFPHTGDPNVVNTSTAISVIGQYPSIFNLKNLKPYSQFNFEQICVFYRDNYDQEGEYWRSKETGKWSPYVTSYVLSALAHSASIVAGPTALKCIDNDNQLLNILRVEMLRLLDFIEKWANQNLRLAKLEDYDQVYFTYTALEALQVFRNELKRINSTLSTAAFEKQCLQVIETAIHRFRLEFYSQMTYKLADLPQHLDVVSLALSMYTLVAHGAGIYEMPDDVLDSALDTVFSLQEKTGMWNTATPLLGAATGRIGCSSIELANCLLRIPRIAKRFEQFYDCFDKLFIYLQRGFDPSNPERGWAVDIRRNGHYRQSWYSFYVFEFLGLFAGQIEAHAAQLILRGFQYGKEAPKYLWDQIADYDNYKERINNSIIKPRTNGDTSASKCSLILFGPPGTGKTSIAGALAHKLGWGLIQIGPGDFLANGLDGIFAQGDLIFQRLLLLNRVVVLFDEIDELVRNRTDDEETMSRFLTTYMLPWIQRLRDKGTVVLIFATNHIEIFYPAIKRLGRFDLVVPIGPPKENERLRIMRDMHLEIDEPTLDSLSAKIPVQATIGEISSVAEKLKNDGLAFNEADFLGYLAEEKLLINPGDWEKFKAASRRYSK